MPAAVAGLENRSGDDAPYSAHTISLKEFDIALKRAKQEGRIPLRRWPAEVLLPFLTEDL
jgi:hypothetical protein